MDCGNAGVVGGDSGLIGTSVNDFVSGSVGTVEVDCGLVNAVDVESGLVGAVNVESGLVGTVEEESGLTGSSNEVLAASSIGVVEEHCGLVEAAEEDFGPAAISNSSLASNSAGVGTEEVDSCLLCTVEDSCLPLETEEVNADSPGAVDGVLFGIVGLGAEDVVGVSGVIEDEKLSARRTRSFIDISRRRFSVYLMVFDASN